jgi:hypothetical protein
MDWGMPKTLMTVTVLGEIQNRNLPNISQQHYHCTNLLTFITYKQL